MSIIDIVLADTLPDYEIRVNSKYSKGVLSLWRVILSRKRRRKKGKNKSFYQSPIRNSRCIETYYYELSIQQLVHFIANTALVAGGVAYVEIYVEACGNQGILALGGNNHATRHHLTPHTSNTATHPLHHCPKQTSHQQQRVKLASP